MTGKNKMMTTRDYAKKTGLAVSTITQMLREGRLQGIKRRGKWAIDPDQLHPIPQGESSSEETVQERSTIANGQPVEPSAAGRYDVPTFARMTYLTEEGVRQWLRSGRLSGGVDAEGKPFVDAANLDRPTFRHLVRK